LKEEVSEKITTGMLARKMRGHPGDGIIVIILNLLRGARKAHVKKGTSALRVTRKTVGGS
jgi:hypothetical protein